EAVTHRGDTKARREGLREARKPEPVEHAPVYNGRSMKIDLFNHFFPKRFLEQFIHAGYAGKDMGKRVRNVPTIADLEARFRVMDEFDEYCQFLSLPSPPLEAMAGPEESPTLARIANDGLADLVGRYPDRFIGFTASLPLNHIE